jgi:hypothetical protein
MIASFNLVDIGTQSDRAVGCMWKPIGPCAEQCVPCRDLSLELSTDQSLTAAQQNQNQTQKQT